jgi:hypothetical protein
LVLLIRPLIADIDRATPHDWMILPSGTAFARFPHGGIYPG